MALQSFAAELDNKPRAARLALLKIFAAGPAADEAMASTESRSKKCLREAFASSPPQAEMSPLLARAIVSGVAFVARTRIHGGRLHCGRAAGELSQWVSSLQDVPANGRLSAPIPAREKSFPAASRSGRARGPPCGDGQLAATNGYWQLTVPRILAAAGLRKKNFTAHFTGVEDCFLATLEQRTVGLVGHSMTVSSEGLSWSTRVHRTIENLCAGIANDSITAKLVFVEARSAGRAAVALQDSLLASLAGELLPDAPDEHERPVPPMHAEASLGAIWGILRGYVDSGREGQLPSLAPILTVLFLAPFSGAR